MQRNDSTVVLLAHPRNSRPWSSWDFPAYNSQSALYGAAINPGTQGVFFSCCCLTPGRRESWQETEQRLHIKTTRLCWKLHVSAGTRMPSNSGLIRQLSTVIPTTQRFRVWLNIATTLGISTFLKAQNGFFFHLPNVPKGCGKLALNQPGKGRRNCDGVLLVFWPQGGGAFGLSLALKNAGPLIINQLS